MNTENTEITKQKPRTLKGLLSEENVKAQFALALPKHLSADRFARVAITALTRTPKLQECTPESFMKCLLDLSALGIEPDGRRAHLIPYGKECTLILDYKGIAELVMRSGTVASIHADKVCVNDAFEVDRGRIVTHKPNYAADRGIAYAYYVLITFKDGSEKSEVMTRDECDAIRKRSRSGQSGPWVSDFDEMAKKTVFRRASKWLPLSPEIQEAIRADEDREFAQARNVTPQVRTAPADFFAASVPVIETANEESEVVSE
jgi:recombination protein RecT